MPNFVWAIVSPLAMFLPDTVVETIGFPTLDDSNTLGMLQNGTYVMPFLSAASDGFLTGIQFGIVSNESVTIQVC
jgi:hypothetical protein